MTLTVNDKRETLDDNQNDDQPYHKLSKADIDQLIRLKLNGTRTLQIAEHYGITPQTVDYHWGRFLRNKAIEIRLKPDILRSELVQRHLRMADDAAQAAATARQNGNLKFASAMMRQETYALQQIARICGFESITLNTTTDVTPQLVAARIAELEAAKAELEPEIVEAEIVEDE